MTSLPIQTIETAPEASKELLKKAKESAGFVPNLYGAMATAPSLLEGYITLTNIFGKSEMSETERQIILMTNNRLNGCEYCMAAHTSLSQMAKVPADVIEALRAGTSIADPKLEALRVFSIVINETRGWPTQEQIGTFLAAGYTQQTILEVIVGTSLKVMSNYTNHITETPVDSAFQPNAWSADEVSAA